ncbi:inositol-3-phosphate synthase [Bacillus sp. A116_S68]|jgi:myo-inositol-1-phosphate synthase|nr:inositol-3-phosphate synthase [Bacillus sp. A116_S68]
MGKRVGVMIIGLNGAVASCLTGGIMAIRKGIVESQGLVTDLPEFEGLNLLDLNSLHFSGWDIRQSSHYLWMKNHGVVPHEVLETIKEDVETINVLQAPTIGVSKSTMELEGTMRNDSLTRMQVVDQLMFDIKEFKNKNQLDGVVVLCLASTEPLIEINEVHKSLELFESALKENSSEITPGMLYAYAALKTGSPYINFTPSVSGDIPALLELAVMEGVPIAGKDGKTGQTLYKTVIAPMLKWRNLRVQGWYSTNILGNDDGKALRDPQQGASKITTKSNVLPSILGYDDFNHQVHIHYYPPRRDAKEAWDSIDFTGWLNTEMSVRVNWIGHDSALAAPLVLDLIRLVWLAYERNERGVSSHLSAFFKAPINEEEHDFFVQMEKLLAYVQSVSPNHEKDLQSSK